MKPILEVIVCSLEDARAAAAGGATRLEVISRYDVGGLTPAWDLVRAIAAEIPVPARIMLREEEPFFLRSGPSATTDATKLAEKKLERLCDLARSFSELAVEGMVLGFLRNDSPAGRIEIDHEVLARVLGSAPALKATFHRAFEELPDPLEALRELKRHPQIDCVLTSGGPAPWAAKAAAFAQWERAARPEIGMLVGGGTDDEAMDRLLESTPIRAFHLGRAVREGERLDGPVQADRVRRFADKLGRLKEAGNREA